MKEYKFNIGDRVIVIDNGEVRKGVIQSMYTDLINPICIVKMDDGSVKKYLARDLALDVNEKDTEAKPKRPTVITCTKDRYIEALKEVSYPAVINADGSKSWDLSFTEGLITMNIGLQIRGNLFGNKTEIELDKYMLLWEIANQITPTTLAEVADRGSAGDFAPLSGTLIDIFMNFITELFGAEND